MIFDLDDRLLDLAKKLVFHETPETDAGRPFEVGSTRKSLKPEERRAEEHAKSAMATLREDEKGPQGVNRTRQFIDAPGSPAVDEQVWKRAEAAQASTASPLPPAMVQRFSQALGHEVSDIHVHTDGNADEICRAANSEVVARGRDVFFRRGVPLPGTPQGDMLLSNAVEQLAVDGRDADEDQPMRRFADKEESRQAPVEEPEESGWGLMGLVGAAMAAKQGYDALKGDDAKKDEVVPETPKTDAELAKVADDGQKQDDALRQDQATAAQADKAPDAKANDEIAGDANELAQREQRLKEVVEASEQQQAAKERLPESDVTKEQVEGLALMGATAGELLNDVREAKSRKQAEGPEDEQEERESLQQVSADVGVQSPFRVAGDYEAQYRRPDESANSDDIDITDHRLLMEVDVDDAANEFESNAFAGDMGMTVDRLVEVVDAELQDQLSGVTGPEREQLRDQIDQVTPALPEMIEQQVRDAAEANVTEEQEALQLELEQEQVTGEGEQAEQAETFAFGARVDLQTGQVVVTTNDTIPMAIESSAPTSAPSTSSGDGGGGGGAGGGGAGGGGGGGGGAPTS